MRQVNCHCSLVCFFLFWGDKGVAYLDFFLSLFLIYWDLLKKYTHTHTQTDCRLLVQVILILQQANRILVITAPERTRDLEFTAMVQPCSAPGRRAKIKAHNTNIVLIESKCSAFDVGQPLLLVGIMQ